MDFRLATLLAVNDHKNFTRAAEELFLTQPAVSNHIIALEEEFGVKIFSRSRGDLKLTPEGEIVARYARHITDMHTKLKQELADLKEHLAHITIGITPTVENSTVLEALVNYGRDTPGITINLLTDTKNNLRHMVTDCDIDLAIVEGKAHGTDIESVLLGIDHLMCMVSNSNPIALQSSVSLEDIKKENMILRMSRNGPPNLLLSYLTEHNMSIGEFNIILEIENIAIIIDMINRGLGIAVIGRSACIDELKSGKIVALPIDDLNLFREVNILYRRNFPYMNVLENITRVYLEMTKLFTQVNAAGGGGGLPDKKDSKRASVR